MTARKRCTPPPPRFLRLTAAAATFFATAVLAVSLLVVAANDAYAQQGAPGNVSNITITRADGSLTASWDAVSGATKYHITYTGDHKQSWQGPACGANCTSNSITIDADNDLTYYVAVRAGNDHGWSGWSNSAAATPFVPDPTPEPIQAPATPASVDITRTDGSLTASWDAVDGATSYHVTYTDNGAQSWQLAALDHTENSIAISVENGSTYMVGVRAKNGAGGSGWRNSASVGPYLAPGIIVQDSNGNAISALSVPEGGEASYEVKLTAPPTEDTKVCIGLSVRDNNDSDIKFKGESGDLVSLNLTFTPSNWNIAQTVTLVAAEDDDSSNGVRDVGHDTRDYWWYWGGEVNLRVTEIDNDPSDPPARPAGLTATASDQSVTLDWDDPSDSSITGYEYQTRYAGVAWSGWTAVAGSDSDTTSFTVTGLVNGTEYRFKIRAVNSAGNSRPAPASAPWYVAATPNPPSLNVENATDNSVTLSLDNYDQQWYYRQESSSGGGGASGASAQSNQPQCTGPVQGSATINGLNANSQYTYGAYSNNQCSQQIASAAANTLPTPPGQPGKPTGDPKYRSFDASWTAPATGTVTTYQVEYRPCLATWGSGCGTDGWPSWGLYMTWTHGFSGGRPSGTLTVSSASATVSNLPNGVLFQVRVRAGNGNQHGTSWGPWSDASDNILPNTQYSLTASNVTGSEATLTVAVSSGPAWFYDDWYYKADRAPHTSCSTAQSAMSVTVTGLTEHASYTYTAYTDSGCTDELASTAAFTTSGDDLTAGSVLATTATLTLASHTGNWWLKRTQPADTVCDPMQTATSKDLTDLDPNTAYIYTAYNDSTCTTVIDSAAFTTLTPTLTASSIATTTATLTIANLSGDWYYMADKAPDNSCKGPVSTADKALTGLTAGTWYTYKAYSDSSCSTANELAAEAFSTAVTVSNLSKANALRHAISGAGLWAQEFTTGSNSGGYTLSSVTLSFPEVYSGSGNITISLHARDANGKPDTTTLAPLNGTVAVGDSIFTCSGADCELEADTQYFVRVAGTGNTAQAKVDSTLDDAETFQPSDNGWSIANSSRLSSQQWNEITPGRSLKVRVTAVPKPSLSASSVTATLTLTGHAGDWWLKKTAPSPAGACTAGESDYSHALSSLTTGTSYTYKAYSDSTCTSEIASVDFTTP